MKKNYKNNKNKLKLELELDRYIRILFNYQPELIKHKKLSDRNFYKWKICKIMVILALLF